MRYIAKDAELPTGKLPCELVFTGKLVSALYVLVFALRIRPFVFFWNESSSFFLKYGEFSGFDVSHQYHDTQVIVFTVSFINAFIPDSEYSSSGCLNIRAWVFDVQRIIRRIPSRNKPYTLLPKRTLVLYGLYRPRTAIPFDVGYSYRTTSMYSTYAVCEDRSNIVAFKISHANGYTMNSKCRNLN